MSDVKNYPPYLDYPKPRKKETNADRIRAMDDSELAEIISENIITGACNDFDIPGENPCPHNCKECVLKWLQQEAE